MPWPPTIQPQAGMPARGDHPLYGLPTPYQPSSVTIIAASHQVLPAIITSHQSLQAIKCFQPCQPPNAASHQVLPARRPANHQVLPAMLAIRTIRPACWKIYTSRIPLSGINKVNIFLLYLGFAVQSDSNSKSLLTTSIPTVRL